MLIIGNGRLVTRDAGQPFFENGAVAIDGTTIKKVGTLDEIKKDGKIKIGVFSDKNPFGYVDENGDVQGYDIYFGKRLAKDLLGSDQRR